MSSLSIRRTYDKYLEDLRTNCLAAASCIYLHFITEVFTAPEGQSCVSQFPTRLDLFQHAIRKGQITLSL
jgi:hypothetical protein